MYLESIVRVLLPAAYRRVILECALCFFENTRAVLVHRIVHLQRLPTLSAFLNPRKTFLASLFLAWNFLTEWRTDRREEWATRFRIPINVLCQWQRGLIHMLGLRNLQNIFDAWLVRRR